MLLRNGSVLLLVFLFSTSGQATNWGETVVTDPIAGEECSVHEPASYGSYIYDWPSKYDGVYWPYTDHHWIWRCSSSGYISFGNDFAELSDDEVARIAKYLKDDSTRDGTDFDRLEAVYRLRNKDDHFWAWFYRVKAAVLTGQANEARRVALELLEVSIESLAPGFELVQLHFVVGDYHRRFGNAEKAKEHFAIARQIEWIDNDGQHQVGSEYIEKLIVERSKLLAE